MADEIRQIDGTQDVVLDAMGEVQYDLAVRIDIGVARSTAALLGPGLNAVYAQALAAILADRTLGGLVMDAQEGIGEQALGLDIAINREPYAAASAGCVIHLTLRYGQPTGAAPKRQAILEAVEAALHASTPGTVLAIRERVMLAFHGHLVTTLAPLAVLRNADRPQRPADGDRIVLCDGDQVVDHRTLGETWYRTQPSVEIFVAGTSAAALDARIQQVRAAIRSADRLGGLAFDVEEDSTDPETLRESYTGACLSAELAAVVTFITRAGDPYALPLP